MIENYPPDLSVEEIKIKIQQTSNNPNIGKTHQVILKNGPRAFRIATIFEILNSKKKELHHLSLQLNSFDKTKAAWKAKPEKNIRIDGNDPNEIKILSDFLSAALSEHYPDSTGEFRVVTSAQYELIENLACLLSYCQELCMEKSGSDPFYFHSIDKFYSSNYFRYSFRMM